MDFKISHFIGFQVSKADEDDTIATGYDDDESPSMEYSSDVRMNKKRKGRRGKFNLPVNNVCRYLI